MFVSEMQLGWPTSLQWGTEDESWDSLDFGRVTVVWMAVKLQPLVQDLAMTKGTVVSRSASV